MDTLLAEYDYDLLADGKRSGVVETDADSHQTTIDWLYDDLGRLTREVYNAYDNNLDFVTDYVLNLAGNRLEKKTDLTPSAGEMSAYHADAADGVANVALVEVNEQISSTFDANDRLLTEVKDVAGGTADDRLTTYTYGTGNTGTQQTIKEVRRYTDGSGGLVAKDTNSYNLQGRMSQTLVDDDGDTVNEKRFQYTYGDDGIRVSQTATTDTDHDGSFDDETPVVTKYLGDQQNPTGYSQVVEEKVSGNVTKTYTLGLDIIAQQAPAVQSGGTLYLLKDGHGSTRGLVDATGQPLSNQIYRYDAFGNAVGFDTTLALTDRLYNGESFNGSTGLYQFGVRPYDPRLGRFPITDPDRGDLSSPLTLHKYLFCHGDPINYNDPTGRFEGLAGMMVSMSIGSMLTAIMQPVLAPAMDYVVKGLLPPEATIALDDLHKPTYMVGIDTMASVGFTLGFGMGGGFEVLAAPMSGNWASYLYATYFSVGTRSRDGVLGSFTAKVGAVFGATRASDYEGEFRSLSAPIRVFPMQLQQRMVSAIENMASWYYSAFTRPNGYNFIKQYLLDNGINPSTALPKMQAVYGQVRSYLMQRLNDMTVSIFWDPADYCPAGFCFNQDVLGTSFGFSYAMEHYWQLNEDVVF